MNVSARKMDPVALIGWIDDITSPTTAAGDDAVSYNPLDPIADQAIRRDIELHIEPDRMLLRTERFRPTGKTLKGAPEIGRSTPTCSMCAPSRCATCPRAGRHGT